MRAAATSERAADATRAAAALRPRRAGTDAKADAASSAAPGGRGVGALRRRAGALLAASWLQCYSAVVLQRQCYQESIFVQAQLGVAACTTMSRSNQHHLH